ncbi:MAG: hypothetical protein ACTHXA_00145 [Gulosibacter sp.]|uniref:hypothetical protein n=1 Tax=Gulosibacter sp. TaxID=2817531 RepID=UPI003F92C6F8
MTRETEIHDALVPATAELRQFAVRALVSLETELDALRKEYSSLSVALEISHAADLIAQRAGYARETVGAEPHEHYDNLIAQLWARTRGRDAHEQLLSVHLNAGFFEDVLRHLGDGQLDDLIGWEDVQESVVDALRKLFELDTKLDDRLAVWGRRIAGDSVLWARQILGIAPGEHPDDVIEGADEIVEAMVKALFAQHSRRMNTLELAA